jgi:CRP-like cAMP-binding protein
MLSTQDTLDILRSVYIFESLSEPALMQIASHLDEVTVQAGEVVFAKGDLDDSMYIIIDGRVRVHDGDLTVKVMEERTFVGEMALLHSLPRSASVTAIVDTRLFRLGRAVFYDVMEQHTDVVRSILSVLAGRLRDSLHEWEQDFTYIQQVRHLTDAAAEIETGTFQAESLDHVARREDELGQLARVFQRMARQVYAREQNLKRQVHELQIEIDKARAERQVQEITETNYFKELQRQAHNLRQKIRGQ